MTAEAEQTIDAEAAIRPVSVPWLIGFAMAWFGFWLLVMLPGQFMVQKLVSVIAPDSKETAASFLLGLMTVIILISVPVVGWLCDKTRPRFGRRKTWALGGFLLATVPFAFIGSQTSVPVVAVLLALVALGQATVLVSLSAMIADQVPSGQRGRASAAMGVPQVIALAGGMVLLTEVVTGIAMSWLVIGLLALVSPLPFLLTIKEPALAPHKKIAAQDKLSLLSPKYRDYYWAMLSRVLINAGNLVGTTYLLFFISDALHIKDADGALTILILIYLVACLGASWLGGVLSDRFNNRRVFIAISAGLQAAAAFLLAFSPTWPSSMVAAVLLGLGYGLFLSVDQALITDLLPNPKTRARDLGIINSAQHIPIAVIIGGFVLATAGYVELYAIAGAMIVIGGVVVYRIRAVR